jgi:hypothetical protein
MSCKLPDSMHWQIYQAYLRGPHALFELFAQAFGQHALSGPPDPDQQQRSIDALSADNHRLKAQVGDVSPHDLRRTAITRALEMGQTYRQVQMMISTGLQRLSCVMITTGRFGAKRR